MRVRTCAVVSTGLRGASPRSNGVDGMLVDADDAHDLLDHVGLAVDVRPPRRRRDLHASRPGRRREKPSLLSTRRISGSGNVEPGETLQFVGREVDDLVGRLGLAGD